MAKKLPNNPPPWLMESMRDIGYTTESALADIIDNSIFANAGNIDIHHSWNNGFPWVAIVDDGNGMSGDELIGAMSFCSKNPRTERDPSDLGRFGLGLKTASISQCRRLIVISRKDGKASCCVWDLDIQQDNMGSDWLLEVPELEELMTNPVIAEIINDHFPEMKCGTLVIWTNLDRMAAQGTNFGENQFNGLMTRAKRHLELVFHRYIERKRGSKTKPLVIKMNNDTLEPLDPFFPGPESRQELACEIIPLRDGGEIVIQPYVLPHFDKVPKAEYDKHALDGGYFNNQGFYLYRNKRLIIWGTWFRLAGKEESTKLVRIKMDIPNHLDHLWEIGIKKSFATPPEAIRNEMKRIIDKIRIPGRHVIERRGHVLSRRNDPFWLRQTAGTCINYVINKEQSLLADFLNALDANGRQKFERILASLQGTFPIDLLYSDVAKSPDEVRTPDIPEEYLRKMFDRYLQFNKPVSKDITTFRDRLLQAEPFASNTLAVNKWLDDLYEVENCHE